MDTRRQPFLFTLLGVLMVALLLLTGCRLTDRPTEICNAGEHPLFEVVYPVVFEVINNYRPTFLWALEEGATCVPDHYDIQVWSVKNYLPGATAGYLLVAGTATTEAFAWPAEAGSLQPGTSYMITLKYTAMRDGVDDGYVGRYTYFSTGPTCSPGDEMSAPNLRWPPDNWRVDTTTMMEFEWDSTMSCWPAHDYYLEISTSESFTDTPIFSQHVNQGEIKWMHPTMELPWENCTRYYWHVRPYNDVDVTDGPWSETWSFMTQRGDTLCPLELGPIITPIPPATLITMVEANCRSGPTMDYPLLSILPAGGQYEIEGTNQDGDSWLIYDPAIANMCWVFGDLVEVTGDTSLVMIIDPMPPDLVAAPTETETPVDCSQWNSDQQACIANPACEWQPNLYPNDPCRNK